jgi:hypothetical protein
MMIVRSDSTSVQSRFRGGSFPFLPRSCLARSAPSRRRGRISPSRRTPGTSAASRESVGLPRCPRNGGSGRCHCRTNKCSAGKPIHALHIGPAQGGKADLSVCLAVRSVNRAGIPIDPAPSTSPAWLRAACWSRLARRSPPGARAWTKGHSRGGALMVGSPGKSPRRDEVG